MKDSRVDVSFHHSDPFNGSIHCPPSLFDRGYFLQSSQQQASFQSCFFLKKNKKTRQVWKGTQKWSFELLFMLPHHLVNSWRSTLLPLTAHIHVTREICRVKWKSSRRMCWLMSERKGKLVSLELLDDSSARLWRQTLRHVKVKDWHQIKACLKSELSELYAHHLSCYQ